MFVNLEMNKQSDGTNEHENAYQLSSAREVVVPQWSSFLLHSLNKIFQSQTLCDLLIKFHSGNNIKVSNIFKLL